MTEECIYCKTVDGAKPPEFNKATALTLLGITGAAIVTINVLAFPFILPALRRICLPYIPATDIQVKNVITALTGRSGRVIDLGSGDGRIVLETAKKGFLSTGIELNPWLVFYSRIQARRLGLNHLAKFYRCDLWKTDTSSYNNVVIFGVEQMMPDLEVKLQKELSLDACVVACRFPLPTWKLHKVIGSGIDSVWVYKN